MRRRCTARPSAALRSIWNASGPDEAGGDTRTMRSPHRTVRERGSVRIRAAGAGHRGSTSEPSERNAAAPSPTTVMRAVIGLAGVMAIATACPAICIDSSGDRCASPPAGSGAPNAFTPAAPSPAAAPADPTRLSSSRREIEVMRASAADASPTPPGNGGSAARRSPAPVQRRAPAPRGARSCCAPADRWTTGRWRSLPDRCSRTAIAHSRASVACGFDRDGQAFVAQRRGAGQAPERLPAPVAGQRDGGRRPDRAQRLPALVGGVHCIGISGSSSSVSRRSPERR